MISSMTGFGRGEIERSGYKAVFEVTSLNSRFLEISFRSPRWMTAYEPAWRTLVSERLSRGKISAQLTWEKTSVDSSLRINDSLVDWYVETLKRVATRHELQSTLSIGDILALPDLWVTSATGDESSEIEGIAQEALVLALDRLQELRAAEGAKLTATFRDQMQRIRDTGAKARGLAAGQVDQYRAKLIKRIEELFGAGNYDMQRLAQEVAYVADRTDVTEECDRLDIHCRHFTDALNAKEPVGRRLNFLLQEMNREINTLGSKSQDLGISALVVDMKEELEKIREQVQNVE
ncbi:MAG: YicC/YloC family endoribonuclease [Candidatus Zixiibacteriota bacterium]